MTTPPEQTDISKAELAKDQLRFALETFRTIFNLWIQVATVIVTANVAVLGYALSNQVAAIVLIGALFPLVLILSIGVIDKRLVPIVYVAVTLENKYGGDDDWLMSTFFSRLVTPDYVDKYIAISRLPDRRERAAQLRRMSRATTTTRMVDVILALLSLAQVAAAVLLTLVFHWRFI